ncbi:hypothetical protein QEG73_22970 [Chitinophagaceae bacterium 26-R-25]|nr:hypothetical protein [Chitinophagaceae bacterium 26-R-25]
MKYILLACSLLQLAVCQSQQKLNKATAVAAKSIPSNRISINDTAFYNVIRIDDKNVIRNGDDYLFNVSIPANCQMPVICVDAKIPSSLLKDIYPEFSKLIVIVPEWGHCEGGAGWYAEIAARFEIFKFERNHGMQKIDSTVVWGDDALTMKFIDQKLKEDEAEIYYTESFGSKCCPRDPQRNKPTREEFIDLFEKQNKAKIINTYFESTGEEGESNYYYTLTELPDSLKLKFILERNNSRLLHEEESKIKKAPAIHTPSRIKLDSKMRKV